MNNFLSLGDITIHRIVELEGPFLPALYVFSDAHSGIARRKSPLARADGARSRWQADAQFPILYRAHAAPHRAG